MKKFFVVSDVHSFYNELEKALNNAGFDKDNKDHIFVSCGDLLDRGPDSLKCLEFVNSLQDDRKILIFGNHEELLQEAIYRGFFRSHDYYNHTNETVYQLTGINPDIENSNYYIDRTALLDMRTNELWGEYRTKLINYYETNKYIFVHGWIPTKKEFYTYIDKSTNLNKVDQKMVYDKNWRYDVASWDEARWLNGMAMWKLGVKEPGKTIICGHWHSSYGHAHFHNDGREFEKNEMGDIISNHKPFYDAGIIALDSCVSYSGFINCIVLEVEDE